ncbi:MAG: metal-sensing transcriptional repressor [Candidatus Paceibacterota bacterium]|jgi:DNA-binding FrmR family transcriptional regulator
MVTTVKSNESSQRAKALISFKKAHSHLGNIIKMVEDGHYCINIMQQNLAVIGLLKSAHQTLMENHLNSCFLRAVSSTNKNKKEDMVKEIIKVAKLSNK